MSGVDELNLPTGHEPRVKRVKLNLLEQQEKIELLYQERSRDDFLCFIRGLIIDGVYGPKVFNRIMAPYQLLFFEDLEPSWTAVRDGKPPPVNRFWLERTKKASKDADIAASLLWILAFPTRPIYMQVGAGDSEQAGIVKERIINLLHYNEWLNDHVVVVQNEVRSKRTLAGGQPMARLHVMTTESKTSQGGTPDILIINELTHIVKWDFAETLMSNITGVPNGIAVIATNAGFKGTPQHEWKLNAIRSEQWCVHIWTFTAPWHSKEMVEDERRRLPKSQFARLWQGRWVSGKGDALDEDKIEQAMCLDGPTEGREPGFIYLAGLDLGISHDHAGLVVIGVNEKQQLLKLVKWWAWEPREVEIEGKRELEVDLMSVEEACRIAHRTYILDGLYYDPTQAELMAQRLRRVGIAMRRMSFSSPTNLTKMATSFLQAVNSGKLQCYDEGNRLRGDFGKFSIVEKPPVGYKLEAVSDSSGHADVGTALVIAMPAAMEMLEGYQGLRPDDDLYVDMGGEDLTQEELDDMPAELREIYEMEGENPEDWY